MKKILGITIIFLILFASIISIKTYAATLNTIDITTNKGTVNPGQNITLNVNFGQDLGAYTVNVDYDNNLLEYVSVEGGTANNTGTKTIVTFYDTTGGTAPRSNMSITFKAKTGITTSNPTDLSVTLTGMANADASVQYDDVTTPIIKDIVVEPAYEDYNISLEHTGNIIVNEIKDMKLIVKSSMGRNYTHTRILAEVTGPENATAKILATDSEGLEHDIVQSGWGDATGDPIGGENVVKELDVRALFNKAGEYSIALKLINKDDSDAEIASKTVNVTVVDNTTTTPSDDKTEGTTNEDKKEEEPDTMPQTGTTIYFAIVPIIALLIAAYVILKKD